MLFAFQKRQIANTEVALIIRVTCPIISFAVQRVTRPNKALTLEKLMRKYFASAKSYQLHLLLLSKE